MDEPRKWGKLTLVRMVKPRTALCVCECGTERLAELWGLEHGKIKTCGSKPCWLSIKKGYHGQRGTLTYNSWIGMKDRCKNPHCRIFPKYGGAGITVCARWELFENFLADMGERPSQTHSIDRFPDNRGNYEPGNCRWATPQEQSKNRRSTVWIEYRGEMKTATEWAKLYSITYSTFMGRLGYGWTIHKCLTEPTRRLRRVV